MIVSVLLKICYGHCLSVVFNMLTIGKKIVNIMKPRI